MSELVAYAFYSWGQWMARCPKNPGCKNAEHFGASPNGHTGWLTRTSYSCGSNGNGCGLNCRAVWPGNLAKIEALLMQRPVANRNWEPGETLADLFADNLANGIVSLSPDALDAAQDGKVFQLTGDHLELTQPGISGDVARLAIGYAASTIGQG